MNCTNNKTKGITPGRNVTIISIDKAALTDSTFSIVDSAREFYVKGSKNPIKVSLQIASFCA